MLSRIFRSFRRIAACVLIPFVTIPAAISAATPATGDDTAAPSGHVQADSAVAAGRYLVVIGGCNDCHTAGYLARAGDVPESDWLTGSPVGWRGPWGTTYPSNLRLLVQAMPEDAWVTMLRTRSARPPMPWMNVRHLSESDSRAIYRYLQALGPRGAPMPAAVDPGVEPVTPYIVLDPVHLERMPAATEAGDGPREGGN